jgi:hypothetical protein
VSNRNVYLVSGNWSASVRQLLPCSPPTAPQNRPDPTGVILTLTIVVRHGFGEGRSWYPANGWSRERYSLAMALQN